jgi:hypothetical protein
MLRLKQLWSDVDTGWKILVALATAVTVLSATNRKVQSFWNLPASVAHHDSTNHGQLDSAIAVLQRMDARDAKRWCVELAKSNKEDWTHCVQ